MLNRLAATRCPGIYKRSPRMPVRVIGSAVHRQTTLFLPKKRALVTLFGVENKLSQGLNLNTGQLLAMRSI